MKEEVPLNKAHRLINHGPVALVASQVKDGPPNVLAVAWISPFCSNPPMAGISIAKTHHSHQLIRESREFTINVPPGSLIDSVFTAGKLSGKMALSIGYVLDNPGRHTCYNRKRCDIVDNDRTCCHYRPFANIHSSQHNRSRANPGTTPNANRLTRYCTLTINTKNPIIVRTGQ